MGSGNEKKPESAREEKTGSGNEEKTESAREKMNEQRKTARRARVNKK
jgi:hypothetical protein